MVDGAETSFPSPPLATTPATLAPLGSDGASLTSEDTLMRLFSLIEFDRRWNLTLRRDLDMVEDCGRGEERREKRKRKRETRGKKGRCSRKGDDRDQRQLPNQRSERKGKEKESSPERRKKGWGGISYHSCDCGQSRIWTRFLQPQAFNTLKGFLSLDLDSSFVR